MKCSLVTRRDYTTRHIGKQLPWTRDRSAKPQALSGKGTSGTRGTSPKPLGNRRTTNRVTSGLSSYGRSAADFFSSYLSPSIVISVDAALVGLIGAIAGAVAGLGASVIAGWQQRLGEAQRWHQGRADEVWRTERQSLIDLTTLIATGCQAMAWVSWSASVMPLEGVQKEANIYNDRMRDLLPRIFSAQAAASGLNDQTYHTIEAVISRLIELDTELGTECTKLESAPKTALPKIATFEPKALRLAHETVETVRQHLKSAN